MAARIPDEAVRTRKINLRALVYATDGPEKAYPVYQFARDKRKIERPRHNPFSGTL